MQAVLVGCSVVASSVAADDWIVEPLVSVYAGYDSNLTLSTADRESATSETAEFGLRMARESETTQISLDNRLVSRRVQGPGNRDTDDIAFIFSGTRQWERSVATLNTDVILDSTLTSELGLSGTGFVQQRKDRTLVRLSPNVGYTLSERESLSLAGLYQDVSYEDESRIPLSNYRYATLSAGYLLQLAPRWTVRADFQFADFDSATDTRTFTGLVGGTWEVDESGLLSARLGVSTSRTRPRTADGDETGLRYELNYDSEMERQSFQLGVRREESPDGSGELRVSSAVTAGWSRQQAELLRLFGSVQVGVSEGANVSDRDYRSLNLGARRSLSEDLSIELRYRYTWQQFERGDAASNNSVVLAVHKRWGDQNRW